VGRPDGFKTVHANPNSHLSPSFPPSLPPSLLQFLFPALHKLLLRKARLASDLVLASLLTALVLLLLALEVFWLPMGLCVCLATLLGTWRCKEALSALFLPVYMLNAVMSGRA